MYKYFLIFSILTLSGCNVKSNLYEKLEGHWDLLSVTINDVDSTEQYKLHIGWIINFEEYKSSGLINEVHFLNFPKTSSYSSEYHITKLSHNLLMSDILLAPLLDTSDVEYDIQQLDDFFLKLAVRHPDNDNVYIFVYKNF